MLFLIQIVDKIFIFALPSLGRSDGPLTRRLASREPFTKAEIRFYFNLLVNGKLHQL